MKTKTIYILFTIIMPTALKIHKNIHNPLFIGISKNTAYGK